MLVSLNEMLGRAKAEGYGVPAISAANEVTLRACIEAAASSTSVSKLVVIASPGILTPNAAQTTPPRVCATMKIKTNASTSAHAACIFLVAPAVAEPFTGSLLISSVIRFKNISFDYTDHKVKHFSPIIVLFNLICVNLSDYMPA